MGVYSGVFPLGLGTNRFPVNKDSTEEEIEKAADIVRAAIKGGVNYIDTALPYSSGMAPEVLKRGLRGVEKQYRITTKISPKLGTAEAAIDCVHKHLEAMGLNHASDVMVWSILSYSEFEEVMKPGGIYEGALSLKAEGIVDNITFSAHTSLEDLLKILKAGVFDGMLVSISALNYESIKAALDYAYENGVDVAAMNPLGGGFIPQNIDKFSFLCNAHEDNVIKAALRFVKSHPAVKVVLAGPSCVDELLEDISAFTDKNEEKDYDRQQRVYSGMSQLGDFCTGCKYCMPCPRGINIPKLMQSRNTLLFEAPIAYRRTDSYTLQNIQIFKRMNSELGYVIETDDNPCINCGMCEIRCTQKLEIRKCVSDMYARSKHSGNSLESRKLRLDELLNGHDYKKVAIWPGGAGYATEVIKNYEKFFGPLPFDVTYFNSNPELKGVIVDGRRIYAPEEVEEVAPDCILVISYVYRNEIVDSLEKYKKLGIDVKALHYDDDVPWVY